MQARSRAFPPEAVFGPAFTPGSPPDQYRSLLPCMPLSAAFTRLLAIAP
jgi:hypothetical protein